MSVEVVVGGVASLDLTLAGLDALPAPGEERFARELHWSPGGSATVAVGLARLGVAVGLAAPLGRDLGGRELAERLTGEGVRLLGPTIERTTTTVVLPLAGERAMATHEPADARVAAATLCAVAPRAAVLALDEVALAPPGVHVFGAASHQTVLAASRPDLRRVDTLLANRFEATSLAGMAEPVRAAQALAEHVPEVVVTLGRKGALAAMRAGELASAQATPLDAIDTTGAGDLFLAAYVWAWLRGDPVAERLRRACRYASLSVGRVTAQAGAATRRELLG